MKGMLEQSVTLLRYTAKLMGSSLDVAFVAHTYSTFFKIICINKQFNINCIKRMLRCLFYRAAWTEPSIKCKTWK